ncbi:MAG: chemotaxis protein CheW [Desulfomonilaceae bacterium]
MSPKQYQNCFVVFRVDDRLLGVPLDYVQRVVRAAEVAPLPKSPPWVLGVLNVQGTIVCILDTRRLLGSAPRDIELSDQFLILALNAKQIGLLADEVIGVRQYESSRVAESEDLVVESPLIRSIAFGEDHVAFILDTSLIASLQERLPGMGSGKAMGFEQWP